MRARSVALFCLLPSLGFAAGFEGVIETTMEMAPNSSGTAKTHVSQDGKFRSESVITMTGLSGRGGTGHVMKQLVLGSQQKPNVVTLVDLENKTYQEMDLSKLDAMKSQKKAEKKGEWKIVKQGKDTVAGRPCDKVQLTRPSEQVDACLASDKLGDVSWMRQLTRQQSDEDGWYAKLQKDKLGTFPLRLESSKNGTRQLKMTVTRVAEQKVPATMFEVPAGYTKNEGMGMGHGMSPAQREQMRQSMEGAMKNMTPEQRAKMQQLMGGQQ